MASWKDTIPNFNPYIQQLPIESMVAVGMEKQKRYDEGLQRIQSQIDQVAGLDIVRDIDKKYLESKLNELGSKLKTVAAGDFSNYQLVNSVSGMAGQIAKDKNVIGAVQSTAQYRKESAFMEESRKKGESAIQNEYDFNQQTQGWMNDATVGAGYNGRYKKFIDVDKKWLEVMKSLHSDLLEEDIPYVKRADGSIDVNQTAAAMQRISKEGVSSEKIENALRASLSPDELEQLNMNGKYQFRGVQDPLQLAAYSTTRITSQIDQNNKSIAELKGALKLYASDTEKTVNTEQGIKSLEALNRKLTQQMGEEIEFIKANPEEAKGQIYKNGAIEQFANAHAWEKQKYNVLTNPVREDEWKARNYELDRSKFSWQQTKDRFGMDMSIKDLELKTNKANTEMYGTAGTFSVYGGASTNVTNQKVALLQSIDGSSSMIEGQVNLLLKELNSAGSGKVEKVQILNALDAYAKGDVGKFESLIPDDLQDLANSIISEKTKLNRNEQFYKNVEKEALEISNSTGEDFEGVFENLLMEKTIKFIPREVPINVGGKEGSASRETWEGITTSILRKAADTSLSGMPGGYEGLDADDAEEALNWFADKNKGDIQYKKLEQGDKTSLVILRGTEEFVIPLTREEAATLPLRDTNAQSSQERELLETQSMGGRSTNASGRFEDSYFNKSFMPNVTMNVRADMLQEYNNPSKQYITLRLKLPDGTVYPLQPKQNNRSMPVNPVSGMNLISNLTDEKIKQLYLESPNIPDNVKEVIKSM